MAERCIIDGVETLADLIAPELDVLFVGYNPNPLAVASAHYYARKANRFWEDLHEAGFVPRVLRGPGEDAEMLRHGVGLTDVVKRPTSSMDGLTAADFRQGFVRLGGLVEAYLPRVVCFNGLGLLERYRRWGAFPQQVLVRAVPSTSPRNQRLKVERLEAFKALKREVEGLKG